MPSCCLGQKETQMFDALWWHNRHTDVCYFCWYLKTRKLALMIAWVRQQLCWFKLQALVLGYLFMGVNCVY